VAVASIVWALPEEAPAAARQATLPCPEVVHFVCPPVLCGRRRLTVLVPLVSGWAVPLPAT
jgi:hypothetical protein